MSRKDRFVRRTIFLACEGQTEEKYFQSIRDQVNSDGRFSVRVQVLEIEDGVPQHPLGLVKEARLIKEEGGYDEAWAVFDKDREPNGQLRIDAFNYASQHGVNIAFSSVAFEHWILLHFEQNNFAFQRSDCESRGNECTCGGATCLCTYLKLKYLQDYSKGGSYKLYNNIKERTITAIENSAWLKYKNKPYLSVDRLIQNPYTLNPHTDIDNLLAKVLELNPVIFGEINALESIGNIASKVLSFENDTLRIELTNRRPSAYVINNLSDFKIQDTHSVLHPHAVVTQQINPGATAIVELTFQGLPAGNLKFRFKESGIVFLVPIRVDN